MRLKVIIGIFAVAVIFASSAFIFSLKGFRITSAATAKGIDDKFNPAGITNAFPAGTTNVYCWFEWVNAIPNTAIVSSWDYVTDDIHVLDYTFDIPRKSGKGGVSFAMPEGKDLPAGLYRVSLKSGNRRLKSLTFRVLEKN